MSSSGVAPPRVLVVDDEAPIRHALRREFGRIGFDVCCCAGWSEVLAMEPQELGAFSVAVLDYYMPGMDGLQLAARLHEHAASLPVLLLSAGSLEQDEQVSEALRTGRVAAVLPKPWDREKLLATVRALSDPPASR